jgi:hypothetical protein
MLEDEALAASASEGRKRPESSSPEKLKARNKEKFQQIQKEEEEGEDDDYDQDFENYGGEQKEEMDIDEEEMLDIAEKCFARMAEEIRGRGLSVEQAFEKYVQVEEVEGEQMLIMSPVAFLEGIRDLGIDDLEEVEVACLMRVLAKPNMDSAILLSELVVIMENFGIGEEEDAT